MSICHLTKYSMCILWVKVGFVLKYLLECTCQGLEANFRDTCWTGRKSHRCGTATLHQGSRTISSNYRFLETLSSLFVLKRAAVNFKVLRCFALPAQDSNEVVSENPLNDWLVIFSQPVTRQCEDTISVSGGKSWNRELRFITSVLPPRWEQSEV